MGRRTRPDVSRRRVTAPWQISERAKSGLNPNAEISNISNPVLALLSPPCAGLKPSQSTVGSHEPNSPPDSAPLTLSGPSPASSASKPSQRSSDAQSQPCLQVSELHFTKLPETHLLDQAVSQKASPADQLSATPFDVEAPNAPVPSTERGISLNPCLGRSSYCCGTCNKSFEKLHLHK